MPFGAYTIRNRSRNVAYMPKLARGVRKFYKVVVIKVYITIQTPRRSCDESKTLEHLQKVRLRQARRHRKTLRAVQGKPTAILERPQEGRRRSRWRPPGGIRRREIEKEIKHST